MRNKAKACGKPSLLRMGYGAYPEKRGWADFNMPLAAWQADCLFCEFMPPVDREEAWLSGSHRVRVVELGWTPVGCAILGSLFKPAPAHLPTIWEMAKDLASCGISDHEAFQGEFKYPSVWILDSAISVLACEAGLLDVSDAGGYCPIECADLWDWPPGWTGGGLEQRFNLIATWFLCA
eukprot:326543-Amphidinium_carterae.1